MRREFHSRVSSTLFFITIAALVASGRALAATYYISTSTGLDSHTSAQAQSKSTPWAHAPGMACATSNANSYSPVAGDKFEFKIGDVWGSACLGGWTISNSGSSGSPIFYGNDDPTWIASAMPLGSVTISTSGSGCSADVTSVSFSGGGGAGAAGVVYSSGGVPWGAVLTNQGSGYTSAPTVTADSSCAGTTLTANLENRPVLSCGGAVCSGSSRNVYIWISTGANYITISNFEFTGGYFTAAGSYGNNTYMNTQVSTYADIKNNYFHGVTSSDGTPSLACILSATYMPPGNNTGQVIEYNVFDGSDDAGVRSDPNCTGACVSYLQAVSSGPIVSHNVMRLLDNGYVGVAQQFNDNLIEYQRHGGNDSYHENAFENNTDPCTGLLFYNNVIRHTVAGVNIWIAPEAGCTPSYAWNNVTYDTMTGNVFDIESALTNPGGTAYIYNNTVEAGPDSGPAAACFEFQGSSAITATLENNHCITSGGFLSNQSGAAVTQTTNLTQTKSVANGQGYTAAETYGFSPANSNGSTVGTGTNLTASCTGSLTFCVDTTYTDTYSLATHTVGSAVRNTTNRPTSLAWDIGAFQSGGSSNPPNPVTVSPPKVN
jgi:hypothetical protein